MFVIVRIRQDVVIVKDWCGIICSDPQSTLNIMFKIHMDGKYDKKTSETLHGIVKVTVYVGPNGDVIECESM